MARGDLIMEAIEHGPQMIEEGIHAAHRLHPHQDADGRWMIGDQPVPQLHVTKAETATTAMLDEAQQKAALDKANRAALEVERAKQLEAENSFNIGGSNVDKATTYNGLEMVSQFGGGAGMAVSTGFAAMAGAEEGKKKIDHLTDFYRDAIANALNIAPEAVGEKELKQFANTRAMVGDTTVQEAIEAADSAAGKGFMRAGTGLGGFFAGAAAGTAVLGPVGSFIGGGIGALAGEQAISSLIGSDEAKTANGQIELLMEKFNASETITAGDVFAVRMHQLKRLGTLVDERCDKLGLKSFDKLDDLDRVRVMQGFPDAFAEVTRDASLLNSGATTPDRLAQSFNLQELVTASQAQQDLQAIQARQGAWAQKVGGPRAQVGSYAEQVRAQQEAAAMQQQQL